MLHDLLLRPRQLREISEWMLPYNDAPDVLLLRCGEDVLVGQGDDRSVFDPAGERRDDDGTLGTHDQLKAEQRQKLMDAITAGADLVCDALDKSGYLSSDGAYNVSSLIVNAIGTVLDDPNADMADVLARNWDETGIEQYREELGHAWVEMALRRHAEA